MRVVTILVTLSLLLAACNTNQPSPAPTLPPAEPTMAATTAPSTANTPENPPQNTAESAPEAPGEDPLAGSQWQLESYGSTGAETPVTGEQPLMLAFDSAGNVTGNGGCNSFGGPYQVDGDKLVLGELISTLVACVDTTLMDQETAYLGALRSASGFQLDGDRLTITYADETGGQGVLNLVRATAAPAEDSPATATPEPGAESTITTTAATQPPAVGSAGPNTTGSQKFIWSCPSCIGTQVWSFENGQSTQINLPVEMGRYFGYSLVTGRLLYSSPLPAVGGGPSQISVGDLWLLDVAGGQAEAIFSDQTIVEAELAPDGAQIAYILATPATYELHWRAANGEDKLLAKDVAFTFSISPNSDKVAFTRESNYNLPGEPGLYVVDVASGQETRIADADRAGAGSIDDKPIWSPSGEFVLLPTNGTTAGPNMIRATVDGSGSVPLAFDPSLSGEEWFDAQPFNAFWVSETQFIGSAALGGANAQMGGDTSLILYQLNDSLDTIVAGATLGEGALVGWEIPGSTVWVQTAQGMQIVPLPAL